MFLTLSEENALITKAFTLFSVVEIDVLTFLNSQFAGSKRRFDAPFSENIEKSIFYGGCVNLFIEEIPQLVIQVKHNFILSFFININ